VRSYAQYLLYDDPPREGATLTEIWSGFQTGLRFTDGRAKPSYEAYRLPIVVQRARGGAVLIWGRVRPGSGVRRVELTRDGRVVRRMETNDAGYFEVTLGRRASYRFSAFDAEGKPLGTSRTAHPVVATPAPD
jgi:hypothetical protein